MIKHLSFYLAMERAGIWNSVFLQFVILIRRYIIGNWNAILIKHCNLKTQIIQIKNVLLQLHISNSMQVFVMKEIIAYFSGHKCSFTFHCALKHFFLGCTHQFLHIKAREKPQKSNFLPVTVLAVMVKTYHIPKFSNKIVRSKSWQTSTSSATLQIANLLPIHAKSSMWPIHSSSTTG